MMNNMKEIICIYVLSSNKYLYAKRKKKIKLWKTQLFFGILSVVL